MIVWKEVMEVFFVIYYFPRIIELYFGKVGLFACKNLQYSPFLGKRF